MFVAAFALVAVVWEGYKAVGPETGGEIPVVGWQLLPRTSDTAMPHVADMIGALDDAEVRGQPETVFQSVASATWFSFRIALFSLVLGVVVGLSLAVVMARATVLERAIMPYLVISQTVPLVALSPVLSSWTARWDPFGKDIPLWVTAGLLGAFLSFFPIAVAGARGLNSVKPDSLELLDSYAATWRQGLFKVRFPSAVPLLVPALKLAAANAVIGVLVSELSIGLKGGIGRLVLEYYRGATGNTTRVFTAVFGAAVLGFAMAGLVALAEWAMTRRRQQGAMG
jgi:NitT/TauT family transport system permease protein